MSSRSKRKYTRKPYGVMVLTGDAVLSGSKSTASLRTPRGKGLFGGPLEKDDLLFGLKREPVAYKTVYGVALDIWDNWFKIEMADKKDKELGDKVLNKLELLHAKDKLTQLAVMERLFGWAILVLGYVDAGQTLKEPVSEPRDIKDLAVYSELEVTKILEDKDSESERYGYPELYSLEGKGKDIHYSRTIHAATRLIDHLYKGLSVLSPIYDDLLTMRYVRWGAGLTMIRYGSGFPDVTLEGASLGKIQDFIDSGQFENLNAMKYFVHNEKQSLEFKGVAGHELDPGKYQKIVLESLSTGSFIPEPMLRGAQAGALEGSEVNERQYFKFISDLQSKFDPYLRQLIDKILIGCFEQDPGKMPAYTVVWNPAFELTDEAKTDILLKKAQVLQVRASWLTVNELRKEEGLGGIPGGDVCLGLVRASNSRINPPGLDIAVDADISNSEKQMFGLLEALLKSAKEGKINRTDALTSAEMLIEEHLNRMRNLVKLQLESKLGKPLSKLSPENERKFITMKKRYLDDFQRILADSNIGA